MPLEQDSWEQLTGWLNRERELTLSRGKPFLARFDRVANELTFTPSETGIERRVGREEWNRFVARFNEIERSGYDPLRPGHYPRVTFNSSYLVSVTTGAGLTNTRTRR